MFVYGHATLKSLFIYFSYFSIGFFFKRRLNIFSKKQGCNFPSLDHCLIYKGGIGPKTISQVIHFVLNYLAIPRAHFYMTYL